MTSKVSSLFKDINDIRKLGWLYALMFFFVASLAYIPGLANADGELFGLFQLDLYDDALHFASGLWAAIAAWRSTRATIFYFKTFGILYGLDGVLGLILGQGYLDGGIFLYGLTSLDFGVRFAANLPHIVIGGAAVLIGFVLSRKLANHHA
jgi:hypothetical protein